MTGADMTKRIEANVLLVDDEEHFLDALSFRLEARGLKVNTAANGEEALEKIDRQKYDLVIIDMAMPGLNGIETMKRIKAIQSDAKIIILTGQPSFKNGIEAMKLGACDFLEKPVDIETMTRIMEDAIPTGKDPSS